MHTISTTPSSCSSGVRWPLALALFASPFLAATAAAQDASFEHETRPPQTGTRPAPAARAPMPAGSISAAADASSDRVLYDERADELWARGEAYKARFGADGARIVPFFGSEAPRNFPLELCVSSATLGTATLDSAALGVDRAGDTVRIDRGSFVEEYELTTESLEQRFVFDELPSDASGDLVVGLDVGTELAGSDLGLSLRFENELGSVDYGRAYAIDADGRRIDLDSTLVDGRLELRVPAGFVEQAALPLVIDPLITFQTVASSNFHELYSDVSYDLGTDRWCVVWALQWSASDHDAYGRLATGAFQLFPGLVTLDFTDDTWTTPKIANNNWSNKFLACFAVVPVSTGISGIHGRFIDPATGTAGNAFPISPQDGAYRNWPDVGGDPYVGSAQSFYCVTWQRSVSASNVDIEARLVRNDGSSLSAVIPIESTNERHELPTISSSAGSDFGDAWWTITWQKVWSPSDRDIYAAQVRWNGAVLVPMFPVAASQLDDTNPVASTILDPLFPGGPRPYVIAYERNFADHDVIATVMLGSTPLRTVNLIGDYPSDRWFHDQTWPAIDSDGSKFLIGFEERVTVNAPDADAFARTYFWDGTTLAASELPQALGDSPSYEADVAIHSMASSGGPRGDFLASSTCFAGSNGLDIVGALCRSVPAMVESVCFGDAAGIQPSCPCGNNGDYGHGCANSAHADGGLLVSEGNASVANDDFSLSASLLPANVACLFFQGSNLTTHVPFGNGLRCVSGATVRLGLAACDSTGSASYPQSGQLPISVKGMVPNLGGTTYYQAWYRDPSAASCAGTFNVTNALRVVWQP